MSERVVALQKIIRLKQISYDVLEQIKRIDTK